MTAKDQFLSNKIIKDWWATVVSNQNFDTVMLHASAVALESLPSAEQRTGVLGFRDILQTLGDKEAGPVKFSSPGLIHALDVPSRTNKPEPETKKTE
jgi:hypothetical protein